MKRDNLIIDVGMHRGEDTEYYLAKGFDVVAVEANPTLVAEVRGRLAREIDEGRLRIIEGAISRTTGPLQFAVADGQTAWSSLSDEYVERDAATGATFRTIEVNGLRFEDILEEVGIPHYLKIDIEGFDMLCVEALHRFPSIPTYVSLESSVSFLNAPADRCFDELAHLWTLGYRGFKYLDQRANPSRRSPNPPREGGYVDARFSLESSGPFGEETPQAWLPIDRALLRSQQLRLRQNLTGFGGRWSNTPPGRAYDRARSMISHQSARWYDLHARLTPS